MTRALVTGSHERAAPVVDELGRLGIATSVAHDLPGLGAALDAGPFDCYVQLPWSLAAEGDTVVARVHHFLASGLLARFVAVERVLDRLTAGAVILLVAGHEPLQPTAPDDRQARLALLRVLAHAARADRPAQHLRIQVTTSDRSAAELVRMATDAPSGPAVPAADLDAVMSDRSYADWRVEILGLATVEV